MATGILRQFLAQNAVNPNANPFGEGVQVGSQLRRNRLQDEEQALRGLIGQSLAAGDLSGARGAAFRGGELNVGQAIGQQITQQHEAFGEQFGTWAGGILGLPEEQQGPAYQAGIGQFEQAAERLGIPFERGPMDRDALRGIAARYGKLPGAGGTAPRFDLDIQEWVMPDGRRIAFRTTTDGRTVSVETGQPINLPAGGHVAQKVRFLDTGTGFLPGDTGTGGVLGPEIPKTATLSPDQRAVRGPEGTVTGAEAVPGSKLDIEQKNEIADKERKRLAREKMLQQAGRTVLRSVTRSLDDYLPNIEQGDNTFAAASRIAQSKIPGTDEFNLVRQVTDFQRNVGLDRLQQMRESSPTGGALGQVPVQQQIMLQETLGSFDIGQPATVIRENLRALNNIYLNIMFGSTEERAVLLRNGEMTPRQNAEIERMYYATEFDIFGRRNRGNAAPTAPAPQQTQAPRRRARNPQTGETVEFDPDTGRWEPVR